MAQLNSLVIIVFTLFISLLIPISFYFIYKRTRENHLFEFYIGSTILFPHIQVLLLLSFIGYETQLLTLYLMTGYVFAVSTLIASLSLSKKGKDDLCIPILFLYVFFAIYMSLDLTVSLLIPFYTIIICSSAIVTVWNFVKSQRYLLITRIYLTVFFLILTSFNLYALFIIQTRPPTNLYFLIYNTLIILMLMMTLHDITISNSRLLNQSKNARKEPYFLYNANLNKLILWNDAFSRQTLLSDDKIQDLQFIDLLEGEINPVIINTRNNEALFYSLYLKKLEAKTGHKIFLGREISDGDENEFFNNLYKFTDSGVCIYEAINEGRDFIFFDVNPIAEKLMKKAKSDIIGKRLSDLIPTALINGLMEGLTKSYLNKEKLIVTVKDYKEGHVEFWMENQIFPIPSGRIVAVFNNQTEKYQLQEQVNRLDKMDQLGQLTGGVAHDFNNQLAIILGYSDLIKTRSDDEMILKFLGNIDRSINHARELTSKLLSFSRDESGLMDEHSINKIVSEFVSIIRHTFDRGIQIIYKENMTENLIIANEALLQNVLLNLAINGRDAMDNKGTLKITLEKCPNPLGSDESALIKIEDNGCGMEDKILDRIFEPLFTTKSASRGTGMGLTLVKQYIDMHKGAILVDSIKNKGTTFSIFLPLKKMVESNEFQKAEQKGNILDANVILIDDEEDILLTLSHILSEYGCTVTTCNDSEKAAQIYKDNQSKIDLVLLDYNMPGMNGYEVFRELKKLNPQVKVVFLSGFITEREQERYLREGATKVLIKPVRTAVLVSTIRNALSEDKQYEYQK